MHNHNIVMIIKITVQYPLHVVEITGQEIRKSLDIPDWDVAIQLTYIHKK